MKWKRKYINICDWNDWFAWFPVDIGGLVLWFENVQRKWNEEDSYDMDMYGNGYSVGAWEYRLKEKNNRKKIYLAGGMKSDWQDKVIEACPQHIYFDPRTHGLDIPKDYTKWDLDHVDKADIIFACFTKDNPSGFGMCIEIGYAHQAGKTIILVDEQQLKSWDIVRCCCLYNTEDINEGFDILNKY